MQLANPLNIQFATDSITSLRVRVIQAMLSFIALGSAMIAIALIAGSRTLTPISAFALVAAPVAVVLFGVLSRGHYIRAIGTAAVAHLAFIAIVSFGGHYEVLIILMMLAINGAVLVAPRPIYWLINAVYVVTMVWFALNGGLVTVIETAESTTAMVRLLVVSGFAMLPPVIGMVTRYFVDTLERTATDAQRTAILLEASANIGQSVSQTLKLDELLRQAVDIIRDRFAFYHVQIFLVDDDAEYAYLTASTGELGEQLLARHHRLRIDAMSVIGRVVLSNEPIVARDTDSGHAANELLADTRSELAIPITGSEGVIGALDVQSRLPNAFTQTEIRVLTVIANQLATAIRNAKLFESQSESLRENKRLFIESETNLREIQRLNRQLTKQAWADYLKTEHRISGVTLSGQDFSNRAQWTERMTKARQRRRPIQEDEGGVRKVAIPLELRGEVVGAIEIESADDENYEQMVDMVQAVSQRLAVSLDNARLFEETQEATAQEQRVGELVSRYQAAGTVDDLLQITLEGLVETLGAESGAIRLGMLPQDTLGGDAEGTQSSPQGGAPA